MNKFIRNIVAFSLKNKLFVFIGVAVLITAGVFSFVHTPIEAFPDVTNTQIVIVTKWNGRSAQEVERFVTLPIEVSMNAVQKKTSVRSVTMFGLSVVKIMFEDDVEDFFARQQVNNMLAGVSLPEGAEPEVQPPYGPTGEIFRYYLKSDKRDSRDLLTWQNWVIDRQLRSVPGVADVVAFGGQEKIYEISADPVRLAKYDITPLELYQAVTKSNVNVGGDVIEKNGQAYVVRGIGLLNSIQDINNIIIQNNNGVPLLVKDLANVREASAPRVGQVGIDKQDDLVEGIVVMRKGENPSEVLARLKDKLKELNETILPDDVKMETFYDRDNLMRFCTHTVMHNLAEGIIFVTVIVFLFMADWRTTVIVSIIIPLALLFAFMCLRLKGMSANLLSMGAIDFGIIIDGAVVMVEGIFVMLDHKAHKYGMEKFNRMAKLGWIKQTGGDLAKAIFFSKLIIIISLVPIFSFQKVEGKMFSPLAWTLGFALLGALLFTLTLVPVLCSILLNKNVKEKNNVIVNFFDRTVMKGFGWTYRNKKLSLTLALAFMVLTFFSAKFLGTEFLPQLNEGSLWVTTELPMSMSLTESTKMAHDIRQDLGGFPEVKRVLSQVGRSNDGTDPNGFYFVQYQVDLAPKEEWKRKITQDELISEMEQRLKKYPGIILNFSQPISDNVSEAVAGFKAANGVKIYGDDLVKLEALSQQAMAQLRTVPGIKDLGVIRNIGQPEMSINLDDNKMAQYGVATADAQAVIEMAIGGKTATQLYEGEKKFDIRIRYDENYRKTEDDLANLMVPTINNNKIPLKEIAEITTITGPAFIYRDNNKRFIGVKFSVRDRDLGSTIAEAQEKINKAIKLPKGYSIGWTGEFENQVRATQRLGQVVPISIVAIFLILFIMLGNVKDAGLVLMNVPFALIGGILALHVTGMNFGISAGVGFIALFGICIQNGVILISVFHKNLEQKITLNESIKLGVQSRVRPVVMTALMAAIGLVPAALSHGIGSETQKPLAIVVIGGLITATVLTLLVFPIIFYGAYKAKKVPL
ncbi:cobalt-zinc-cadmium resistance protein CzcA [Chitinophaga terrae (ex Kim and Jung 2007)]|uniref:Cobalt-zinc-cadmium resistance protein CzcA n=1 Tax=Chitinophaga terrae (ex Kim and Jung 2007) TaxID=408074 RepID=A0A1H4CB58_9BACT|nr:CusA/CzcA family heavy metal efflux RND transporter [Chitinophaga terrae (ex Kim and Jung 2007)]MDQ0110084.1 cobalt-zinc-cadmium resistance protein CzcA [Chitinophaga terrae (ex Kim and Jung 2007)]GEP88862.1 cation transporter [Chitinophaga terrae (ex Kim and Jung 2007)]SEA57578.1 cobalt-zinc-cadmium resistance protein CzcA [Chitinophaga terrae (ex Kim and Jung 2007)]